MRPRNKYIHAAASYCCAMKLMPISDTSTWTQLPPLQYLLVALQDVLSTTGQKCMQPYIATGSLGFSLSCDSFGLHA